MSTQGFSSILKLTELDDFITPSQECIKPAQSTKPAPAAFPAAPSSSKVKIELENDGSGGVLPAVPQKVEINLTDCLACSGCITSAESILISQQSPEELVRVLEKNKNAKGSQFEAESLLAVVTLGTQPVVSLANKYGLHPQEIAERLSGFFKFLGADKVSAITLAEDLCLIESGREFIEKYETLSQDPTALPIISGVCPGWICYAEKLHPYALKNISRVKSPQQIMGSLLKLIHGARVNRSPDQIYHITLMPCFDRKLESSRKDFMIEDYRSKEVDSVITPLELENLLESMGKSLLEFEPRSLDNIFNFCDEPVGSSLMSHLGSGSGGFAEFVLRAAAEKYGCQSSEFQWIVGRNPDISEATITTANEEDLKFSVATGFRNIQTIVRKLKTKLRSNLPHYIELMACPTGCLNGGAQLRPQGNEGGRELALRLDEAYKSLPLENTRDRPYINQIYDLLGSPDSKLYNDVLYTQFHAIEKLSLGIKW